jgi:Entner-Doudoroff aldolase|tara:strand:- start:3605 stop:4246 length:642 start_codon:yes stop_codon:yes gene_type:complete
MSVEATLEQMALSKVVAIIRVQDSLRARELGAAIISGGLPIVEVSLNTPGALEAIEALAKEQPGVIGAGTVLEVADVARVAKAGAKFIVTPNLNPDIVRAGLDEGLVVGPGVFTATECHQAMALGAHVLKLFPAANAGISGMKALMDPFPSAVWLPTGGIAPDNISHWLHAGAFAVGVGSALTNGGSDHAREVARGIRDIVDALGQPVQQEGK